MPTTAPCPDDHVLGQLVELALAEGEAEVVRVHLDDCASCREVVAVMARARLAMGTPSLPAVTADATPSARKARSSDAPPRALGRYRLDRLVGAGGMGQVFAAHDTELDRPIALKLIRPELAAASPAFAERLRRESRLMAKVSHPSVIAVYDVGNDDGRPWIAMELVVGATLGAHLRARPRGWREVVDWFRQAGSGLAAAHAAGLVHRDFKPENVLCALDGDAVTRVVVTDFGVATAAGAGTGTTGGELRVGQDGVGERETVHGDRAMRNRGGNLTGTGVAIGTPAYMAPEQLAGEEVDARADTFAFAVALWEALWGARPFRGSTIEEIKEAQRRGEVEARRDPEAGGHVPHDVPSWVAGALAPALALEAARRPRLDVLLRALDAGGRSRRARITLVAAGAAALMAGTAVAATLAVGGGSRAASVPVTEPCIEGDRAMDAIWSPAQRDATRSTLVDASIDARVVTRVSDVMDERVAQWRTTFRAACGASEPSRPLQLACLDARRVEMAGWVESVLGGHARHAELLVGSLAMPGGCLAPSPASVYAQVPADPTQRGLVLALRARLFDAERLRMDGDFESALAEAEALRPAVEASDFVPLAAELEYLIGTIQSIGGDSQASADVLRRAVALAERGHHDHITAVARLALAQDAALNRRDLDLADQHVEFAQAAIDRLGGDADLQVQLDSTRVIVLGMRGRYAEAEALITQLLTTPAALPGDTEIQLRQQLGDFYLEQTRVVSAIEQHRAVVAKLEAMGPAGQANLSIVLTRLADDLVARGDAAAAVATAERAQALAEKVVAATHVDHWAPLVDLASAYHLAGRTGDALAAARRYRRALESLTGATSVYAGEGMRNEGRYLAASGARDEGIELIQRGCDLIELHDTLENADLAGCDFDVAEALREGGFAGEALPLLEEVAEVVITVRGEDHADAAVVAVSLGEALVATGEAERALPMLERAHQVLAASELDPGLAADAAIALARALPRSEVERSRVLVEEAIGRYEGAAPLWKRRLAAARKLRQRLR